MYSLLFTVMDLTMNAFWGFCLCRFFCSFLRRKRRASAGIAKRQEPVPKNGMREDFIEGAGCSGASG